MAAGAVIEIRRYQPADQPAVLDLLAASLGWVPDALTANFFTWKHHENPAGPSPAWIALDGDRVVSLRTFIRWEFQRVEPDGVRTVSAVRAVDTATHPQYQEQGIFSRLTRQALDELKKDGVAFVFNTPNRQSRPRYLKMGWRLVGRLPVLVHPRSLAALARIARARTPADKWSMPTTAGLPVGEVTNGRSAEVIAALLASVQPDHSGLSTRRTPEYLTWRYGFAPLAYRVVLVGDSIEAGLAIFRLRRRGPAVEAAVCEMLLPDDDRRQEAALLHDIIASSGADYAVRIGGPYVLQAKSLPMLRQGPTLVWRAVCETTMPPLADWHLSLGDIELF